MAQFQYFGSVSHATMREQDLPKAVLVLNKAYEYLTANGAQDEEGA